jgi:hypothetical protein
MSSLKAGKLQAVARLCLLALPVFLTIVCVLFPFLKPPEKLLYIALAMAIFGFSMGLQADKVGAEVGGYQRTLSEEQFPRNRNLENAYFVTSMLPPTETELFIKAVICSCVFVVASVVLNASFASQGYFGGYNAICTGFVIVATVPIGRAFGVSLMRLFRHS